MNTNYYFWELSDAISILKGLAELKGLVSDDIIKLIDKLLQDKLNSLPNRQS